MNREMVLEALRMILTAFVIALVINFARVLILHDFNAVNRNRTITGQNNESARIQTEQKKSWNYNENEDVINITLSPLKKLSGLSKNEILDLRIDAVKNSPVFGKMHYIPNPNVFQITDGLPWISADSALHWSKSSNREKADGVTRDSAGILNPDLLYYVSIAENEDSEKDYKVIYKDFYFFPYKATYNPNTKTITAYIKNDTKPDGDYQPITLADANAHDLGFRYAYMDYSSNIGFYEDYKNNTLASDIKNITGYYMHGSACGIPGGCNNYAPYWQYYNQFYLKKLPAEFNIKLWKNPPNDINTKADINFRMVFEKSN